MRTSSVRPAMFAGPLIGFGVTLYVLSLFVPVYLVWYWAVPGLGVLILGPLVLAVGAPSEKIVFVAWLANPLLFAALHHYWRKRPKRAVRHMAAAVGCVAIFAGVHVGLQITSFAWEEFELGATVWAVSLVLVLVGAFLGTLAGTPNEGH